MLQSYHTTMLRASLRKDISRQSSLEQILILTGSSYNGVISRIITNMIRLGKPPLTKGIYDWWLSSRRDFLLTTQNVSG